METEEKGYLSTGRILAFSDGVFAVALTLLVFELKVPELLSGESLFTEIWNLWPKFLTFIVSASIIGIFWAGHYIMFRYIKGADRTLLWLNTLLLIFISAVPFAAALLGTHHQDPVAVAIYGALLGFSSLTFSVLWWYASKNRRLIREEMPEGLARLGRSAVLLAPAFYFVATIFAFVEPLISKLLYLFIPLAYLLPGPIDKLVAFNIKD